MSLIKIKKKQLLEVLYILYRRIIYGNTKRLPENVGPKVNYNL